MMIVTLLSAVLFSVGSVCTDEVPPPQNLRIKSENLGLVLEWDPPQTSTGEVLQYTAEYTPWNLFQTVCENISSPSCDFTSLVTVFGIYHFRVRTELNGRNSTWTEIECEPLEKITVLGAPGVRLQSRRGKMEVEISEPTLARKNKLKDAYVNISYRIRYWTKGEKENVEVMDQNRVMLMNLLPHKLYCVKVEIIVDINKTSLPSESICEMNTDSDEVEPWLIVVVLFVSFLITLVCVLLISLTVWFVSKGIRFLHPRGKLPEHFKQYLSERPSSSILLAMENSAQPKELYHEFSIITAQEVSPESK